MSAVPAQVHLTAGALSSLAAVLSLQPLDRALVLRGCPELVELTGESSAQDAGAAARHGQALALEHNTSRHTARRPTRTLARDRPDARAVRTSC